MKAGLILILLFFAGAVSVLAQANGSIDPGANPSLYYSDAQLRSFVSQDLKLMTSEEITIGKNLHVTGPLVHPLKARKISQVPKRLLDLINPFAPAGPKTEITRVGRLSSRSWTSIVGWRPGTSAFPDPTTHEPSLTLISVSRP